MLQPKDAYDAYANWHLVSTKKDVNAIKQLITGSKTVWRATEVDTVVYAHWREAHAKLNLVPLVIDFGCGMGRNGPMLQRYFDRVIGYDLPDMIAKQRHLQSVGTVYHELVDDLSQALLTFPTAVYECVVWQHLKWECGAIQIALDMITASHSVVSIYSCWNAKVEHQHQFAEYLQQRGWTLVGNGEVQHDQLETIGNVPHNWYLFCR